jgi:hypothetical protein
MSDHVREPTTITAMHVGRADLGAGSAFVEDDALIVVVTLKGSSNERPIRVPIALIDGVALRRGTHELILGLRDGTQIMLASPSASSLRDDLLGRCRSLPELTRALRTFGSRRGHRAMRATAGADQQRFFAPLLQARRMARTAATPVETIVAFDSDVLTSAYASTLQTFASERVAVAGASRRALEAELVDAAEPLMESFTALGSAATTARTALDDLRLWRAWSGELRSTFETADRVWIALDVVLEAVPARP